MSGPSARPPEKGGSGCGSRVPIHRARLRLIAGDRELVAGKGDPGATLKADRFEVTRAISGRRSVEQVRAMLAQGDPEPYLPLISTYAMPERPLVE